MPLFECSKCHCVENTALSNYAWNHLHDGLPPLCSECDPEIGKWHGQFTNERAPKPGERSQGVCSHPMTRELRVPQAITITNRGGPSDGRRELPNVFACKGLARRRIGVARVNNRQLKQAAFS